MDTLYADHVRTMILHDLAMPLVATFEAQAEILQEGEPPCAIDINNPFHKLVVAETVALNMLCIILRQHAVIDTLRDDIEARQNKRFKKELKEVYGMGAAFAALLKED